MASRTESLNTLQSSIDTILLNIGSAFNESTTSASERFEQTRSRLRTAIPLALNDFHAALDALEDDLFRATAIISRDLAVLQANDRLDVQSLPEEAKLDERPLPSTDSLETVKAGDANDDLFDAIMVDDDPIQPESKSIKGDGSVQGTDGMERVDNSPAIATDDDIRILKAEPNDTVSLSDSPGPPQSQSMLIPSSPFQAQKSPDPAAIDASQDIARDSAEGADVENTLTRTPSKGNENASLKPNSMLESGEDLNGTAIDLHHIKASPSNDLSALLPGLDMYANDPNGDPGNDPLDSIEGFNDMSTSNVFNEGVEGDHFNDFPGGALGGDGLTSDFGQEGGGFDDLISLDAANNVNAQGGDAGGGLDLFDEEFFNLGNS